jgi:death-on-curing protein
MHYLSIDDLLDLHALALERFSGRAGIASADRLTATAEAPRQVLFGAELYPDAVAKAAVLAFLLIKNRPFHWGNELTAVLALCRALELNGLRLAATVDDAAVLALVRRTVESSFGRAEVEAWVRRHAVPHDDQPVHASGSGEPRS